MQLLETYEKYLQDIMIQQFNESMDFIQEDYHKKKIETDRSFLKAMDHLCNRCNQMQETGYKGDIAVISIFFLKSSILTDNYNLQINLYDGNFYLDRKDIFELWDASIFMKHFIEDMTEIKRKAFHNLIGFTYADYLELKMQYAEVYNMLLLQFCKERAEEIITLTSYKAMKKWGQIMITYGGFMDKGICIYSADLEKGS